VKLNEARPKLRKEKELKSLRFHPIFKRNMKAAFDKGCLALLLFLSLLALLSQHAKMDLYKNLACSALSQKRIEEKKNKK